jgi:Fe2+ or Zn2+ uptake regulation protein
MADRNTIQKEIIHHTLCAMGCHPTAAMVYEHVHRDHPTISRSTVYRVLSRMAEEGKILRLDLAGGDSRYDGRLQPHSHVRCRLCGAVADLPAVRVERPSDSGGFLLEDCAVVYRGLCAGCRQAGRSVG